MSQGIYLLNEELLYLFHNDIQSVKSNNAGKVFNTVPTTTIVAKT